MEDPRALQRVLSGRGQRIQSAEAGLELTGGQRRQVGLQGLLRGFAPIRADLAAPPPAADRRRLSSTGPCELDPYWASRRELGGDQEDIEGRRKRAFDGRFRTLEGPRVQTISGLEAREIECMLWAWLNEDDRRIGRPRGKNDRYNGDKADQREPVKTHDPAEPYRSILKT